MSEPAFDRACFDALAEDLGEAAAREACGVFFVTTRQCLDKLAAGASLKHVVIQAHAIKSSAATFGFDRLAALARRLESDAAALAPAALSARLAELQAGLAQARADLDGCDYTLPHTLG